MTDPELLRPLWQYPLRWLTFEDLTARLSYLSESERAARRASWSAGRRSVKPIGLVLCWTGTLLSILGYDSTIARGLLLAALLPFAFIGLRGWLRDGAAEHDRSSSAVAARNPSAGIERLDG